MSTSTTNGAVRYDQPDGEAARRKRRAMYLAFTWCVSVITVWAVIEALVHTPVLGMDRATARAQAAGVELEVRYPSVTRGDLAANTEITVRMTGGVVGEVTIAVPSDWSELFSTTNVSPQPVAETSTAAAVLMTFAPPGPGEDLQIELEQQAHPAAWFDRRTGTLAVVDADGRPIVAVDLRTDVRP